jgi:hypothetical protein
MLEQNQTKGLIHITYNLAEKLSMYLDNSRLIWHTKEDKMRKYKEFRETTEPKVMIASGLYEGIDLAGDDYKWQVITKIPFPSLAEPAIKFKAEKDPVWYHWETLKVLIQACGRICRGPTDSGTTYIIDSSWRNLYDRSKKAGLLNSDWLAAYEERPYVATQHEDIRLPERVEQRPEGRSVVDETLPHAPNPVHRPFGGLPKRRWG